MHEAKAPVRQTNTGSKAQMMRAAELLAFCLRTPLRQQQLKHNGTHRTALACPTSEAALIRSTTPKRNRVPIDTFSSLPRSTPAHPHASEARRHTSAHGHHTPRPTRTPTAAKSWQVTPRSPAAATSLQPKKPTAAPSACQAKLSTHRLIHPHRHSAHTDERVHISLPHHTPL